MNLRKHTRAVLAFLLAAVMLLSGSSGTAAAGAGAPPDPGPGWDPGQKHLEPGERHRDEHPGRSLLRHQSGAAGRFPGTQDPGRGDGPWLSC